MLQRCVHLSSYTILYQDHHQHGHQEHEEHLLHHNQAAPVARSTQADVPEFSQGRAHDQPLRSVQGYYKDKLLISSSNSVFLHHQGSFSIPDSDEMVEGLVLNHNLSIMATDKDTNTPLAVVLNGVMEEKEALVSRSEVRQNKKSFHSPLNIPYDQYCSHWHCALCIVLCHVSLNVDCIHLQFTLGLSGGRVLPRPWLCPHRLHPSRGAADERRNIHQVQG